MKNGQINLNLGKGLEISNIDKKIIINGSDINEVGTITTGTWEANPIKNNYVSNDLTIDGGQIDNTIIGKNTPAAGNFTELKVNGKSVIAISVGDGLELSDGEI